MDDPKLICGWFALVRNTIAKYGVAESDIYNFDETGFMMGVISTDMLVTNAGRCSSVKLSRLPGCEWVTVIQGINSQGWMIPPFIIVAGKYHLSTWYDKSTETLPFLHERNLFGINNLDALLYPKQSVPQKRSNQTR